MPEALGVFRASDLSFFGRGAGSLAEREKDQALNSRFPSGSAAALGAGKR